jgi:hypothetical protein
MEAGMDLQTIWTWALLVGSVVLATGCVIGIGVCLWWVILALGVRSLTMLRSVAHHLSRLQEQKAKDTAERNRMKVSRLDSDRDLIEAKRRLSASKAALRCEEVEAEATYQTVARDAQAKQTGLLEGMMKEMSTMREAMGRMRQDTEDAYRQKLEAAHREIEDLRTRPVEAPEGGAGLGLVLRRLDELTAALGALSTVASTVAVASVPVAAPVTEPAPGASTDEPPQPPRPVTEVDQEDDVRRSSHLEAPEPPVIRHEEGEDEDPLPEDRETMSSRY